MRHFQKVRALFLLLVTLGLISSSLQTKKVNCRKYVYAPVCRGVAAKRALPHISLDASPKSVREPRAPTVLDVDTPIQWKDKDKGSTEKGLLQIMFQKLDPKIADYGSGNTENYLN